MFLEGELLDELPTSKAVWLQTLPNPVPPGKTGNLMIMLRRDLANFELPLEVGVETGSGQSLEARVEDINDPIQLAGIYFSSDLDEIYVYLENTSEYEITPENVYLDSQNASDRTDFFSAQVPPKEKGFLRITPSAPLRQGEYISVRVESSAGEAAQAVVRAWSHFPITSWDGDTREELHFDPEPFHLSYDPDMEEEELEELPGSSAWYLMGCPNCRDRDRGKPLGNAGNALIEKARKAREIDPSRPSHTHICDASKERTYFLYGEACDIMFINPYEVVFRSADPAKNGHYAALAKLACRPRPLMTIPEAFEMTNEGWLFPSPEQLRLGVYYQLAEGVKGVSYYVKSHYERYPELEAEIGRVNEELRAARDYLKVGEPFGKLAASSDPKVSANAIVCADKGLAVILINTDYETATEDGKRHTDYRPREGFHVEIEVPAWLEIDRGREIGAGINATGIHREDGGKITVPMEELDLTGILLFTSK